MRLILLSAWLLLLFFLVRFGPFKTTEGEGQREVACVVDGCLGLSQERQRGGGGRGGREGGRNHEG